MQISRSTLSDKVASALEESLSAGEWAEGTRLPGERELCEIYSVSRTVLREAVRSLEQRGLLDIQPARGIFVRGKNLDAVVDGLGISMRQELLSFANLIEARRIIEVEICSLAAERRSEENLLALDQYLSTMADAMDDRKVFLEADHAFHIELAKSTRNRIFVIWIQPIIDTLEATRSGVGSLRDVRTRVLTCHEAILTAIRNGDCEAARNAARAHLDQFLNDTRLAVELGVISAKHLQDVE